MQTAPFRPIRCHCRQTHPILKVRIHCVSQVLIGCCAAGGHRKRRPRSGLAVLAAAEDADDLKTRTGPLVSRDAMLLTVMYSRARCWLSRLAWHSGRASCSAECVRAHRRGALLPVHALVGRVRFLSLHTPCALCLSPRPIARPRCSAKRQRERSRRTGIALDRDVSLHYRCQ